MILNQATDYAFRIVLFLSRKPQGIRAEASEISEKELIPERFLFKVMRKLVAAKIVKSFRGVNGGFEIARPAEDITMLNVVEAVEGPIYVNACFKGKDLCNKNATGCCVVHKELGAVRKMLSDKMESVTFRQLLESENANDRCCKEGDSSTDNQVKCFSVCS